MKINTKKEYIQDRAIIQQYYLFGCIPYLKKVKTRTHRDTYLFNCLTSRRLAKDKVMQNTIDLDTLCKCRNLSFAPNINVNPHLTDDDYFSFMQQLFAGYNFEPLSSLQGDEYQSWHFISELMYLNALYPTEIWFDHSWGGGTETYTFRQFEELKKDTLCIRIQDDFFSNYKISYYYQDIKNSISIYKEHLLPLLSQFKISKLVVNNLATYTSLSEIFDIIRTLKQQSSANISFRGHDLQCICPTINMVNHQTQYCNCKNLDNCKACIALLPRIAIKTDDVSSYQRLWYDFLKNDVDEILVFSKSTRDIFTRIYPDLDAKIIIKPHKVPELRAANVPAHDGINIAILGGITVIKGLNIVKEMETLLDKYPNVKLFVIGPTLTKLEKTKVLGKYTLETLPEIVEQNNIDLIFIPSIWSETFSYTTSEAIQMQIPVACFNLGAPAERVSEYTKGLVIDEIDAAMALQQIVTFLETFKKNNI